MSYLGWCKGGERLVDYPEKHGAGLHDFDIALLFFFRESDFAKGIGVSSVTNFHMIQVVQSAGIRGEYPQGLQALGAIGPPGAWRPRLISQVDQNAIRSALSNGFVMAIGHFSAITVANIASNLDGGRPTRGIDGDCVLKRIVGRLNVFERGHRAQSSDDRNGLMVKLKGIQAKGYAGGVGSRGDYAQDGAEYFGARRDFLLIGEWHILHDTTFDGLAFTHIFRGKLMFEAYGKDRANGDGTTLDCRRGRRWPAKRGNGQDAEGERCQGKSAQPN
jgi:hypothetical protein